MEIINNNDLTKSITFKHKKNLYILHKKTYTENLHDYIIFNNKDIILKNNRFTKYSKDDSICLKIKNYTPEDLYKYSTKKYILQKETYQDYLNYFNDNIKKTLPVRWIKNIIDNKKEKENILLIEKDFILCKDLKWEGNIENLYLLVIFKDYDLYSIRSLNNTHLELLNEIKIKVLDYIKINFGINNEEIIMYFHYHPSYWHLHLHIQNINSKIGKRELGEAILLEDVIYNIEMKSDYYQKDMMIKKSI